MKITFRNIRPKEIERMPEVIDSVPIEEIKIPVKKGRKISKSKKSK